MNTPDADLTQLERDVRDRTDMLIHNTQHSISHLVNVHLKQTSALLAIVKRLETARLTSEVAEAQHIALQCLLQTVTGKYD